MAQPYASKQLGPVTGLAGAAKSENADVPRIETLLFRLHGLVNGAQSDIESRLARMVDRLDPRPGDAKEEDGKIAGGGYLHQLEVLIACLEGSQGRVMGELGNLERLV